MYEFVQIDPASHIDEIIHVWWKAYEPHKPKDDLRKWLEEPQPVKTFFGAKTGGRLVATVGLTKQMDNAIRGANLTFGGISGVATLPEHRRRRLVRGAFEQLFEYANQENIIYSALGPFDYPFYEKFGYAHAELRHRYTFHRREFRPVKSPAGISLREYDPAQDAAAVMEVQKSMARFGSRVFLPMWILQKENDPHRYVLEQAGEVVGFAQFEFSEPAQWQLNLKVYHTWFKYDHVLPALVDLVARTAEQAEEVEWTIDPEVPLEYYIKNPGHEKRTREGEMMVRVIKWREFCQQIRVPLFASEPVVIGLQDDNCPWNNGVYQLTPVSGRLEIETTDKPVEIPFNAVQLSHAVGGLLTANRLLRLGALQASPDAAERFTRIFPPDSYISYVGF
jgi:predicted acetyltransferase